jgi:TetR/AcrR family transcriptional repressor of nem operon
MQQNDPKSSYEDAIAVFASLVGGLILARAVGEEALSARILKATTKRVIDRSRPRKNGHRSKTMLEVPDL